MGSFLRLRHLRPLVSGGLVLAFTVASLAAQANVDAHEQTRALTKQLMSPFCPGLLLSACPSPRAFELRADIERRIGSGESSRAIIDDLVRQYGAAIRGEPPLAGFGLTFWTALAVAGMLSFAVLATVAAGGAGRRRSISTARAEEPTGQGRGDTSRLSARLDDELRDLD